MYTVPMEQNKPSEQPEILITGASGNVGRSAAGELVRLKIPYVRAASQIGSGHADFVRHLDFTDATTFDAALRGIAGVFLVRPPALANVKKYFEPFIDACTSAGVEHIVFLSLQGVEQNPLTPHYKIEQYIRKAGIPYTFLRPSFFMQNLTTTHLREIQRGELYIPAGQGRTNFVDTRDVGAVAAKVLAEKERHYTTAYEITGTDSYTYHEVAALLTARLGYTVRYRNPHPLVFLYRTIRSGVKPGFAIVMLALYTVAKLGKAAGTTNVFEQLMGRKPGSLTAFIDDHLDVFTEHNR